MKILGDKRIYIENYMTECALCKTFTGNKTDGWSTSRDANLKNQNPGEFATFTLIQPQKNFVGRVLPIQPQKCVKYFQKICKIV